MRLVTRPLHHRAVRELREAAEQGDAKRLAALLDPAVAVIVDRGDREERAIRVVRGAQDAITLLTHGLAPRPGLVVDERSVNAQAGLMITHSGRTLAAMTVDFTRGLVSVVWIRLHPVQLRHWNAV